MSEQSKSELELIVEEMRRLGVQEYRQGDRVVVLGVAPAKEDERSEEEQQRARDEREKKFLAHKRKVLLAASNRIGPREDPIR